jgi:hypothetical protein
MRSVARGSRRPEQAHGGVRSRMQVLGGGGAEAGRRGARRSIKRAAAEGASGRWSVDGRRTGGVSRRRNKSRGRSYGVRVAGVEVEDFCASWCGHHRLNGGDVLELIFPQPPVQASSCGTHATRAKNARGSGVCGSDAARTGGARGDVRNKGR